MAPGRSLPAFGRNVKCEMWNVKTGSPGAIGIHSPEVSPKAVTRRDRERQIRKAEERNYLKSEWRFHLWHIPHHLVGAVGNGSGQEFAFGAPLFPPVFGKCTERLRSASADVRHEGRRKR